MSWYREFATKTAEEAKAQIAKEQHMPDAIKAALSTMFDTLDPKDDAFSDRHLIVKTDGHVDGTGGRIFVEIKTGWKHKT
jgi:hypothetical protein